MDAPVTAASEPTPAQSNRSDGFSFSTYLLCFGIAMILYALSPGPIAKCALAAYGSSVPPYVARAAEIAYAPIAICGRRFPAVEQFYNWYMKDVWGPPLTNPPFPNGSHSSSSPAHATAIPRGPLDSFVLSPRPRCVPL